MQLISGDPLDRKTFAYLEDDWHDEMNANLEKTVGQANDIQTVLLGDASESTLDGYSADSVQQRLSDLESGVASNDTDITNLQNDVDQSADTSVLREALSHLAVGIAAASSGSTLDLQSGSNLPLNDGDLLVINELDGGVQTANVSGSHSEGATSIALQSSLSSAVAADAVVTLDPTDMREGSSTGQIKDVLWGTNDPSNIGTDHESRLQQLNSRVGSLQDRVRSVESVAASSKDKAREVEGTVTSVKTTAESAAIEARKLQVTDTKILELDGAVDATVSSLSVRVNPDLPSAALPVEIRSGDILALKVNTGNGVKLITAGADAVGSSISTLTLNKNYEIDAPDEAGIFLTSTSIASRVAARTNGNVLVRGDSIKSATFDGTIEERPDGYHYFQEDADGNPKIGTTGWALTSGGEIGARNAYLHGLVDMTEGFVSGRFGLGPASSIVAQSPDTDTVPFHLSRKGIQVEAVHEDVTSNSRALRFNDSKQAGPMAGPGRRVEAGRAGADSGCGGKCPRKNFEEKTGKTGPAGRPSPRGRPAAGD